MKTLERRLGLGAVVAISISAMLGSGIFVLPGMAAAKTGTMVWLAYLVAGLCALPAALSKSELATAMPTSGGTYVYLERSFGPLAGTIFGFGLWLSLLLKSAFALIGFSAYLSVLLPDLPNIPVALALLVAITALNLLGVSVIGKIQKIIIMAVLAGTMVLALAGLQTMNLDYLNFELSHGTGGFIAAAAFVFVSYDGVTKIAAIAEEVKNPDRNLPLGILLSWFLVMCVYVFVVFLLVANVPLDQLTNYNGSGKPDYHPIHTLATVIGGKTIGIVAAIFAVLTMTSMAVSGLLAASRFPFAMGRDKLLPVQLQNVSATFKTPMNSIFLTAIVMAVSILFLPIEQIAKLASSFKILEFVLVCGTVIVLRENASQWYNPKFRSPIYPWLQLFGIVAGAVLICSMGLTGIIAIIGITLMGAIVYFGYGRRKTSRKGEIGKMGRRPDLLAENDESHTLEDELPAQAAVVVPLFGTERSPETLVEMGAALAHDRQLEVLHVSAIPEQLSLADSLEEDHQSISLRRRVHAMAREEGVALDYNTTVSRDVVHTIHSVADRLHCEWVVMESAQRRQWGVTFQNPLGWLQDHLPCNLAVFKDAGVRYIRKILVYAEPGPHDSLVVTTADHLAKVYQAELDFICFSHDGLDVHSAQARADYIDQLREMCVSPSNAIVLHGDNEMEAIEKAADSHDLLIMGAPPDRSFVARLLGTPKDKLTRNASCSVLWLKTPRSQTHGSFDVAHLPVEREFNLMDYLAANCTQIGLSLPKKEDYFRLASDVFAGLYDDDISPIIITTALWEREQMQNTSVGAGVAMPHATLARAKPGQSFVAILKAAKPIDYGAPDGKQVDIFFFTMGPPSDRTVHLKILAELSKLTLHTSMLEEIRSAQTSEEILAITRRCLNDLRQTFSAERALQMSRYLR